MLESGRVFEIFRERQLHRVPYRNGVGNRLASLAGSALGGHLVIVHVHPLRCVRKAHPGGGSIQNGIVLPAAGHDIGQAGTVVPAAVEAEFPGSLPAQVHGAAGNLGLQVAGRGRQILTHIGADRSRIAASGSVHGIDMVNHLAGLGVGIGPSHLRPGLKVQAARDVVVSIVLVNLDTAQAPERVPGFILRRIGPRQAHRQGPVFPGHLGQILHRTGNRAQDFLADGNLVDVQARPSQGFAGHLDSQAVIPGFLHAEQGGGPAVGGHILAGKHPVHRGGFPSRSQIDFHLFIVIQVIVEIAQLVSPPAFQGKDRGDGPVIRRTAVPTILQASKIPDPAATYPIPGVPVLVGIHDEPVFHPGLVVEVVVKHSVVYRHRQFGNVFRACGGSSSVPKQPSQGQDAPKIQDPFHNPCFNVLAIILLL